MSLRAEIREAIDEVAPPAPGLFHEALGSVFERARPKPGRRPSVRFRAPLALVAALVVLSLIAGLFIGGRMLRDMQISAGLSDFNRQAAELEARPVNLPALQTGDSCADSGVVWTSGTQYGNEPVWVYLGSTTSTPWGRYVEVTFRYVFKQAIPAFQGDNRSPALRGPVVVRGRDLKFGWDIAFVGAGATGAPVGTDPAHAPPDLRAELVIDTSHPGTVEDNSKKLSHIPSYGLTTAHLGIQAGSSGCFGLQIDTLGVPPTETITVAG